MLIGLQIVEGSVDDYDALTAVMKGQEACICTAGNVEQKTAFQTLFKSTLWSQVPLKSIQGPKPLQSHTCADAKVEYFNRFVSVYDIA